MGIYLEGAKYLDPQAKDEESVVISMPAQLTDAEVGQFLSLAPSVRAQAAHVSHPDSVVRPE